MCEHCDYSDILERIDDMLGDDRFYFAEDTLTGIRDWIEENDHATERQKEAVENIYEAGTINDD